MALQHNQDDDEEGRGGKVYIVRGRRSGGRAVGSKITERKVEKTSRGPHHHALVSSPRFQRLIVERKDMMMRFVLLVCR